LLVEWSYVGDKSRGKKYISNNDFKVLPKINNGLRPSLLFRSQGAHQSLGQVQFSLASLGLSHSIVLVIHGSLELVHELLKLSIELGDKGIDLSLLLSGLGKCFLGFSHSLFLWFN